MYLTQKNASYIYLEQNEKDMYRTSTFVCLYLEWYSIFASYRDTSDVDDVVGERANQARLYKG